MSTIKAGVGSVGGDVRRKQLQVLVDRAAAARTEGSVLVETEFSRKMAQLEKSSRRIMWVGAKVLNGVTAALSCFVSAPKNDLDVLAFNAMALQPFLSVEDSLEIDDAIAAAKVAQRDVLARIHAAGGVGAINSDHPLAVEYMKVNGQVEVLIEQVQSLYRNTVVFSNV